MLRGFRVTRKCRQLTVLSLSLLPEISSVNLKMSTWMSSLIYYITKGVQIPEGFGDLVYGRLTVFRLSGSFESPKSTQKVSTKYFPGSDSLPTDIQSDVVSRFLKHQLWCSHFYRDRFCWYDNEPTTQTPDLSVDQSIRLVSTNFT